MKKALKLCAVMLALALCICTIQTAVFAEGFADVAETDYFYEAVQWGLDAGVTQGVGDNLFAPEGKVTRAQLVTFLWRMAGQPETDSISPFFDVFTESEQWYTKAVLWAADNGIAEGYIEGPHKVFGPDDVCDRAMCLTFLYRFLDSPFDGMDLSAVIELNENSSPEEIGIVFIQELYKSLREGNRLPDVPAETYYEYPVLWGLLSGVITEYNTSITDENIIFRPNDPCARKEMISFLYQAKLLKDAENAPYEIYAGSLKIPVPQEYYDLLYFNVNAMADGETGLLLSAYERASVDAAAETEYEYDGIGEIFSIMSVNEDELHELLCSDMSGQNVFAKDSKGIYYIFCTPTDVRYHRETPEKMQEDAQQWTELNEWANNRLQDYIFANNDDLTQVSYTNTNLDMYLARIAYQGFKDYTISTTEFGPYAPGGVDPKPYCEFLLGGGFDFAEGEEAPDGEYAVLSFPADGVRFDFFKADENLVREVRDDYEVLYRRANYIPYNDISYTEAVTKWYYSIAEKAGDKEDYKEVDKFLGDWHEEIAGRGMMTIDKSVGLAKAEIKVRWAGSARTAATWEITANLANDGKLTYSKCKYAVMEYDESGNSRVIEENYSDSGTLELTDDGKLIWNYEQDGEMQTATFVKN